MRSGCAPAWPRVEAPVSASRACCAHSRCRARLRQWPRSAQQGGLIVQSVMVGGWRAGGARCWRRLPLPVAQGVRAVSRVSGRRGVLCRGATQVPCCAAPRALHGRARVVHSVPPPRDLPMRRADHRIREQVGCGSAAEPLGAGPRRRPSAGRRRRCAARARAGRRGSRRRRARPRPRRRRRRPPGSPAARCAAPAAARPGARAAVGASTLG